MTRRPFLFPFLLALALLCAAPARADCVNPAGPEGKVVYNVTYKTAQFCNGTQWISMGGVHNVKDLAALSDVDDALAPSDGDCLVYSSAGGRWSTGACGSGGGGADNLGDHTATQDLDLATHNIVNGGSANFESNGYLNFGSTAGPGGYGIRDNAGAIQCKNSGDTWGPCGGTGSLPACPDGDSLIANAGAWICSSDDPPDPFVFADQTDVPLSTQIASNIVQITGISAAAGTSIGGDGSPEYRICDSFDCSSVVQNWTSTAKTIQNNQYLQLRLTSSASDLTLFSAMMTVGASNSQWDVTTNDNAPATFSFTDQTDVALSILTTSNIVQITGITGAAATSITGAGNPEYRTCSDASCSTVIQNWTTGAATIQNNQYLQLRLTNAATDLTARAATMTVGTGSDNWSVTTNDNAPATFSFTDQTAVALSTLTTSNIVQITGITGSVATSISGTGGPEYRTCSNAACSAVLQNWTTGAATIQNNQYVQLRLTSSASFNTMLSATLTVGTGGDQWDVTTLAQDTTPNAFSFTDQTAVALSTLTTSNIVQITGITGSVATSTSGTGGPEYRTCSNAACSVVLQNWTTGAATIQNNQYVQLRLTSSASFNTMLSATLTVGTGGDQWDVTTLAQDTTPNAFSFTDQTAVALSTLTTSNIVQITGITGSVATSTSGTGGPEYRTCSNAACSVVLQNWTTGAATIQNNQYVQLRLTSASADLTARAATMTIGAGNDNWSVTTNDNAPTAFNFTDQTGVALSTLTTSNIVQITGITGIVATSIAGGGSPEYRTCSDSGCSSVIQTWTAAPNTIQNNQYIQLRLTSSVSPLTMLSATMTVGSGSNQWDVTTVNYDDTPNAFSFTDQNSAAVSTLVSSNIVQITGLIGDVPVSISGQGGAEYRTCSNATCSAGNVVVDWTSAPNTIQNNQRLQLRLTSSASFSTALSATVTVGTGSDNWSVTTVAQDTTPTAFNFSDQTAVTPATLTASNIAQITGITGDVATSISGQGSPQYRTCSDNTCSTVLQNWTSGAATIQSGQYIQLRLTSDSADLTLRSATMTVGTGSDDWNVTTNDNAPTAFNFTDQTGVALSTLTTSNIVQITGMTGNVTVSISGGGSPEYRTCSNATCSTVVVNWTSSPNTIQNNQRLQVRLTSSATAGVMNSATVTVGTVNDQWDVTTEPPDPCIGAGNIIDYTTPGTFNYVIPAGKTQVGIKTYGAGGGGSDDNDDGAGGGGGSVVERGSILLVAGGGGGGAGGVSDGGIGGGGGYGHATVSVSAGQTLNIWVGGGGQSNESGGDGGPVAGGNGASTGGDSTYGGGGGGREGGGGGGDSVYGGAGGPGDDSGDGGNSAYGGGGGGSSDGSPGTSTYGNNGGGGSDDGNGGGGGGFGDFVVKASGQTAAKGGPGNGDNNGSGTGGNGKVTICTFP